VEEYVREFDQLQMRVQIDEEPELKIAKFIKGLSLNDASKVNLQACLWFDDVYHLATKKLKSNLRVQDPFKPIFVLTTKGFFTHNKVDITPTPIKVLNKGKGIACELPKWLKGKNCFRYHGYGNL